MILQALSAYYERRVADPDRTTEIAPPGWEWKALPFIVEIDRGGRLVQIADTRQSQGKRLTPQRFLVPQAAEGRTATAIRPNLLWDTVEYALGIDVRGQPARVRAKHAAFVDSVTGRFGDSPDAPGLRALLAFLSAVPVDEVRASPYWSELIKNPFISFRVAGEEELICQLPAVHTRLVETADDEPSQVGLCLVTGDRVPIARLHPPIRGVRDATSSGASLVSFNLDAFTSFNREQGANAPVGIPAAFAYTTALNDLLGPTSHQKVVLADATVVFWSETRTAHAVEEAFAAMFDQPPFDDPARGTRAVEQVYRSVHTGGRVTADDDARFYVLGLSPNRARLAIRFWHAATVRQLATRMTEHFDDLEIVRPPWAPPYPSLARLLASTALLGKRENVSPTLAGDVVRAVLDGLPYPVALLQAAALRTRAEHDVPPVRAALIKATVNRLIRSRGSREKELAVSLDPANPNPAYRLGRLFAVLERAQELASPGLNATIRDRYYGAASTSPVTVFSRLLTLKNHHLAKLDSTRIRTWIERLIGEILDGVDGFPAHLNLTDQGAFAVGYYHQRQALFTKTDSKTGSDTTEE